MNITTVHQPNIEDYDDFDIQVNAYDGKDWLIRFFFDKEHGKWSEPTYIYSVADNESPFENEMKEEYVPQELRDAVSEQMRITIERYKLAGGIPSK
jgi:hypothetical protein